MGLRIIPTVAVHGFETTTVTKEESDTPYVCIFRANVKGTSATKLIALFGVTGVPETASKLDLFF